MTSSASEVDQGLEEALRLAKLYEFKEAESILASISQSQLTNGHLRTNYFFAQEKIKARGDFEIEAKAIEAGLARDDLEKLNLMKFLAGLYLYRLGQWEIAGSYYEKILAISPKEKSAGKILKILGDANERKLIERKVVANRLAIEAHQARSKGDIKLALKLYLKAITHSESEENIWHGLVKLAQVYPSIVSELSEEVIERAATKLYRGGKNEQVDNCYKLLAMKSPDKVRKKVQQLAQRVSRSGAKVINSQVSELILQAHLCRGSGEFLKAEELYLSALHSQPDQKNIWDGLRLTAEALARRFLLRVCPPPDTPITLEAEWLRQIVRAISKAQEANQPNEAEKIRGIAVALIKVLGKNNLPLVMKARRFAYQQEETFLANYLDKYIFYRYSADPLLIHELVVHNFLLERSSGFLEESYKFLNGAKQQSGGEKSTIILKMLEIAVKRRASEAARSLADELYREFGPDKTRDEAATLFLREEFVMAGILLDKLLERGLGNKSLWHKSFQIGDILGDYDRCKAAYFNLRRNLSSKQDKQFQEKLEKIRQGRKKPKAVTFGQIRSNSFWDGTARIPGDIVASRVTGIKLPRPAPPLSGRVEKEVKRPIKK